MTMAKQPRVEDPAYLAWLRQRRCADCKRRGRLQRFRSESHHVGGKGMGGARLRDDIACPLCRECHMRAEGQTVDGLGPIGMQQQIAWADQYRARYLRESAPSSGEVPW